MSTTYKMHVPGFDGMIQAMAAEIWPRELDSSKWQIKLLKIMQ